MVTTSPRPAPPLDMGVSRRSGANGRSAARCCRAAATPPDVLPSCRAQAPSRNVRTLQMTPDDMARAVTELEKALPAGTVITGDEALDKYRNDSLYDPSAGRPLAAVRPRNPGDVQLCMKWAHEHAVPVVPRGAGTGLAGGAR